MMEPLDLVLAAAGGGLWAKSYQEKLEQEELIQRALEGTEVIRV